MASHHDLANPRRLGSTAQDASRAWERMKPPKVRTRSTLPDEHSDDDSYSSERDFNPYDADARKAVANRPGPQLRYHNKTGLKATLLTCQVVSTISQDNTAGKDARRRELMADFGSKIGSANKRSATRQDYIDFSPMPAASDIPSPVLSEEDSGEDFQWNRNGKVLGRGAERIKAPHEDDENWDSEEYENNDEDAEVDLRVVPYRNMPKRPVSYNPFVDGERQTTDPDARRVYQTSRQSNWSQSQATAPAGPVISTSIANIRDDSSTDQDYEVWSDSEHGKEDEIDPSDSASYSGDSLRRLRVSRPQELRHRQPHPRPSPSYAYRQTRQQPVPESATPQPAKRIVAEDFTRSTWKNGSTGQNRELLHSQTGRYERFYDRRGSGHGPGPRRVPSARHLALIGQQVVPNDGDSNQSIPINDRRPPQGHMKPLSHSAAQYIARSRSKSRTVDRVRENTSSSLYGDSEDEVEVDSPRWDQRARYPSSGFPTPKLSRATTYHVNLGISDRSHNVDVP